MEHFHTVLKYTEIFPFNDRSPGGRGIQAGLTGGLN
jgi:hypothetical protein